MSEHMPLAFALQERVIDRLREVGTYRTGKLIYRPIYRNNKQRRLYADAVFGRMFQVAEGFMAEGTDA